jgi:hypothetical protein
MVLLHWLGKNLIVMKSLIHKRKRLVFNYGESVESVEDKLYERDIVLNWEKNLVQDETYES